MAYDWHLAHIILLLPQSLFFDERRPALKLSVDKFGQRRGIGIHPEQGASLELLAGFRRADEATQLGIELLDNRRRQTLRAGQPEPDGAAQLRVSELGERRHVLQYRDALRRRHRERNDSSRRRVLQD